MDKELFYYLSSRQLLALTAYGEAGNEGEAGMAAVLNVIRNRTLDPDTFADKDIYRLTGSVYHAVILKDKQFSMYNANDPVRPTAERIARNFNEELKSNSKLQTAYGLAGKILEGSFPDNTMGATFYHANYVMPYWASILPVIGRIGKHIFYANTFPVPPIPGPPGEEELVAQTEETYPEEIPEEESLAIGEMYPSPIQAGTAPSLLSFIFGIGIIMVVWSLSGRQ